MKRMALACVLISTALLSGCIIVPHRHGGHRHHRGYSSADGHSQGYQHGHQHGHVYGPGRGYPGRR